MQEDDATRLQQAQPQCAQEDNAGTSTPATDSAQPQLQRQAYVQERCEEGAAGTSNGRNRVASSDGKQSAAGGAETEHNAGMENACMPPNKKKKGRDKARVVGNDWGMIRRARATRAKEAHTAAVKDARAARRATRRGDDHRRTEQGEKRQLGVHSEVTSGENEGKRRKIIRDAGRDGTGAVPDAVT